MAIDDLKQRRDTVMSLIADIRTRPKTRMSATGVMIHQAWEITEWENLDEELGKLNATIHQLESSDQSTFIQLIPYKKNYVIETHIKGGILIKGGLLESYFKNRVAKEHDGYVMARHNKKLYTLGVVECGITPDDINDYTKGSIVIEYQIDDIKYSGTCSYYSRVNQDTYFYFALSNIKVKCDNGRGISETGKDLLKYICAMEYRKIYKQPDCNINLVDY